MRNIAIVCLLGMLIAGCGQKKETADSEAPNPIEAYLKIKDALVKTDPAKAQAAAKAFLDFNTNTRLKTPLETIANSQEVAIQRVAFETLSMSMYDMVKGEGSDVKLYKQYCPMAFNDKGAYWLALESEVNNPYFGDLMLHCGFVQEVISQ